MTKQTTLLIIVFIIIVAATGYLWFGLSGPAVENAGGEEFSVRLAELRRLKNLQLDTSVLEDQFFRSLELPQETPLPEVKIGRINPFAPF
ncbi:MAG: hypothetical protein HYW89_02020 [Candidatus Sungiibacteriota bacterium]|uniref:Uncharacterized protein n=1 Tax=Candidatus Sungiibacteriota bacterium TaxID=2750080 RepID=A0A7T5RL29_9BACT|nr:MAG: hypothetical protein HYW89_02020 [Candidatus Sungbacteria bacterium]